MTRRRALVTGGAGFIGGHLVERLVAEDHDVLVVDDLSTGRADNVPRGVRFERLDIAVDDLAGVLTAFRPAVAFHLAAQSSVPLSATNPLRDLAVNVVGTHRVAAAARDAGVTRLVFVSSGGAIYGETVRPATERSMPRPVSYYGVHKLTAEGHVALSGIDWAIVRPSNVYGPRQAPGLEGAVVAAFLDQARHGGPLVIHGDGRQTRDFVHVVDVVAALARLGRSGTPGGIWNVSTGRRTAIRDLAQIVEDATGVLLPRMQTSRRAGDVTQSAMSAGRLRTLGWRPTVGLRRGVTELAAAILSGAPAAR